MWKFGAEMRGNQYQILKLNLPQKYLSLFLQRFSHAFHADNSQVLEGTRTLAKLLRYFLSNFLEFSSNFIYSHLALRWTLQEEKKEDDEENQFFVFVFNSQSSSSCCSLFHHLSPIFPISRNFEQTNKVSWKIFAKISTVEMIFSCDFHFNFPPWWIRVQEKQVEDILSRWPFAEGVIQYPEGEKVKISAVSATRMTWVTTNKHKTNEFDSPKCFHKSQRIPHRPHRRRVEEFRRKSGKRQNERFISFRLFLVFPFAGRRLLHSRDSWFQQGG